MFMSAMNDDASPAGRILSNLTTTTLLSLSSLVQTHSATAASALLHTGYPTGYPTGNLSGGTRNPMLDFSHGASTGLVGGPNDQPAWLPASVTMVRGACLVVFSVLGACFNTFMIVAIAPNRRLRTVRNILLVHLGAVGLLSSMFTTAYPAIATFHGQWLGGRSMCQTYAYVTCVFTSVSVWTIAALSWDKYQTIASPLHHSLTASIEKMLPCFLAFWACGVILSLPPLLGANEFVFHTTMGICGVNHSSSRGRWYTCLLVAASFVLPFCLMLYCYAHIFRIARTQSSRIAATMLRMVSVIQAPIAAPAVATSHGSSSLSLRGTKAMGTILQLIGSFVLTYLPYSIIVLYEVVFAQHANAVFVSIATTLFLAAPFTHAAIYGLRNQILRTSFYRYSRRKYQDMRGRRGACCWARCCRGGTSSSRDKRRGSVKVPSGNKPAHSVSYVKRGSMGQPQAMRCVVKADGRQYVLRRAVSYQEHHNGLDHHHRHDHQYQQDTGPNPSLGQDNPHSPGPLSNVQPSSVLGAPGKTGISIPRPHSFSDVFRSASVNSLGNANPGVTCYPTSPLLLHHNGTGHGKNLGYSSLLEGCVGLQGPAEATLPNSASFCAAADEPPSSASSSYYHIPDCRVQRSHQQPANHHQGQGK
ncbi:hypothetical protein EGW08_019250 [Elysia chlorotica]|uniref:G-protein coupled receptors family 1 profile domain-containing protein n=1 Tax=Elysia chlorotica TaxID=188477 RepID=A0A3S0ZQL0_ELYCH|nr:hypothetical protein EGW08_019250 [Elysia chlorotica]